MPKLQKERIEELKLKVREHLIINPKATIRQIAEIEGISTGLAQNLLKEIRKERLEMIEKSVDELVAKASDERNALLQKLWDILRDVKIDEFEQKSLTVKDYKEVILAINKIIADNIETKFNAGIFQKDLGNISLGIGEKEATNFLKGIEEKVKNEREKEKKREDAKENSEE